MLREEKIQMGTVLKASFTEHARLALGWKVGSFGRTGREYFWLSEGLW